MKMQNDFLFKLLFLCIFIVNQIANATMAHLLNLVTESKINSKKIKIPYLESVLSFESNCIAMELDKILVIDIK